MKYTDQECGERSDEKYNPVNISFLCEKLTKDSDFTSID